MAVAIKPGSHVEKYAEITCKTIDNLKRREIPQKFLHCIPQESRGALIYRMEPAKNGVAPHDLKVKSANYSGAKNEFQSLSHLVKKIMKKSTPTFEFRKGIFETAFMGFEGKIADKAKADWNSAKEELEQALSERGYCENILTPFEHLLTTGKRIEGELSVPIAVQNKKLTIEKASNARELVAVEYGKGEYFVMQGATLERVSFALYPLDSCYGMPILKPTAIDRKKLSDALVRFSIQEAFHECWIRELTLNVDKVTEIAKAKQPLILISPA